MSLHTQTAHDHSQEHEHGQHEHGGPATYTRTLAALLVLTAITVGAAYINFGSGNVVIALTIATIKASLVGLFFMHLRWEKPVNALIGLAGFLFLGIFIMFCLIDFDSRNAFLPVNLHQTTIPLAPGSAPLQYTIVPPAPSASPAGGVGVLPPPPAAEKK